MGGRILVRTHLFSKQSFCVSHLHGFKNWLLSRVESSVVVFCACNIHSEEKARNICTVARGKSLKKNCKCVLRRKMAKVNKQTEGHQIFSESQNLGELGCSAIFCVTKHSWFPYCRPKCGEKMFHHCESSVEIVCVILTWSCVALQSNSPENRVPYVFADLFYVCMYTLEKKSFRWSFTVKI